MWGLVKEHKGKTREVFSDDGIREREFKRKQREEAIPINSYYDGWAVMSNDGVALDSRFVLAWILVVSIIHLGRATGRFFFSRHLAGIRSRSDLCDGVKLPTARLSAFS